MYSLVAAFAWIENFFPPSPSDLIIAAGAFVTARGAGSPWAIFFAAWGGSAGSVSTIYWLARRHGRRFFDTGLGRRLVSADAIANMEREYLRFGVMGIFLARLLPGFRAVVPPFTGLINLSPGRAIVPMVVASGLWYGGITILATAVSAEWSEIARRLHQLDRTLGIAALIVVAALAGWIWWRRRNRPKPIWVALHAALGAKPELTDVVEQVPTLTAEAILLLEMARADRELTREDQETIRAYLTTRVNLLSARRPLTRENTPNSPEQIAELWDLNARLAVASRLWELAFRDAVLSRHEERLMRRAGELLALTPEDLARTRGSGRVDE